ncbi:MAG: LysM peptidoglycan-binding domain-containing protein [Chloroflexota bacterium]|jgi:LysM repeat protein
MNSLKSFLTFLLVFLILAIFVGQASSQTSYVIQPGDTLASISRRFGVSVSAIATANNIVNPNLIYSGQTLVIPTGEPSAGTGGPATLPPTPAPPSGSSPPIAGATYVIKSGDTLSRIALSHGVSLAALVQANGISNPNLIYSGQVLTIPGTAGPTSSPESNPPPPPPPATPTPALPPPPAPPPAPTGQNLLPNPSFEGGYYHINGVPELQVPNGWFLELDTHQPYIRPESRVLSRSFLPSSEVSLFIWDGDWTMKVFKGGARISFRLFTDVSLGPGTYQFSASYFPDLVSDYNGGGKVWSSGGAGEVAFIKDGIGAWSTIDVGSRNTMVQTFTMPAAGNVRIGVAFRTTWNLANNGFFIDDWSLRRVSD